MNEKLDMFMGKELKDFNDEVYGGISEKDAYGCPNCGTSGNQPVTHTTTSDTLLKRNVYRKCGNCDAKIIETFVMVGRTFQTGSRNYNLNRSIDRNSDMFEKDLQKLMDKYKLCDMETQTFDCNGNEVC
jgi:hypothetical protein